MAEIHIVTTLDSVSPAEWNACQPGILEDHAYLLAVERAGIEGFAFRYILLEDDGRLLAAAPMFLTRYPLETTLEGDGPRIVERIRQVFPAFLAPKLACIGSPCTETATIGLSPDLPPVDRISIAARILEAGEGVAARAGANLVGLKDVSGEDQVSWAAAAAARGLTCVPGLPIAWLPIDFPDVAAYLAGLSPGTRKNMRRKLRGAPAVRVEIRENIDDVIDRVMALYGQTLDRADLRFETLTADYFRNVLAAMAGRAFACLYRAEGEIIGFNLLLRDRDTLLDKYFCMDAARGRQHDLYFLSWFNNLGYCLDHGLTRYVAGQAAYDVKRRLGCRLEQTSLYFRHRQPLINRALRMAAPILAPAVSEAA